MHKPQTGLKSWYLIYSPDHQKNSKKYFSLSYSICKVHVVGIVVVLYRSNITVQRYLDHPYKNFR